MGNTLDKISVVVTIIDRMRKMVLAELIQLEDGTSRHRFATFEVKGNHFMVQEMMGLYDGEPLQSSVNLPSVAYTSMLNAATYSLFYHVKKVEHVAHITGRDMEIEKTEQGGEVRHGYIRGYIDTNSADTMVLRENVSWMRLHEMEISATMQDAMMKREIKAALA